MTDEPQKIIKRDGRKVDFDQQKIFNAIWNAYAEKFDETLTCGDVKRITGKVVAEAVRQSEASGKLPTVEGVQDIVERTLIAEGMADLAKRYIIYRSEHARIRETKDYLMGVFQELTWKDAADIDIKRENANIDANTAMGTMLKYGSTAANFFVDNYILPKDISYAHRYGDFHIHDKDFFLLTETCCQIDLLRLFENGFTTGHGYLREPNSIISAAALTCIAIQANQNDMHGGQAIPHFDYCMAPYVNKTFQKEYKDAFTEYLVIQGEGVILRDQCEREAHRYFDKLPTLSTTEWEFEQRGIYGVGILAEAHEYAVERAKMRTDRATYQAMEALVHNFNTLHSRAGAQVPFSSLNYGTDTSPEGRMVIKNLLLATQAGLGNGETPIFPVQIFKVKEGVNYDTSDPNYDLFKLAMETSAKRLFPNFSFLDAPFNKAFYTKPGDWNREVAYMG